MIIVNSYEYASFWIQVHDVPLKGMTTNITKWIGSSISTLEEVNIPKDGTGWGHFLQMRVKTEVTKPLQQDKKMLVRQANLA